ncbi:Na+/H+ antiporter subunit E [Acinetobacter courvalinii]|uniref:Na+/H+ antiporter subunit E n=1 Tax=Acinetobacter courvalinii TaxID=280147 RepID=UPI000445056A|nr:Na+/H+ antiporter subunit E [Acinetobacter courvalinii]EXB25145.1 na+/H+ ion antiporter subunit [Acinetobacter baumannii 1437282]MCU4369907.1 Na+/H+ antiporter subunit E [Acinetobacter courvalinii]MCU4448170.1 Na+/H+ antiporter subunit E [Acinetobacter courvalinii]
MQKLSLLDRWFPHPFVSVLIFVSWLMLAHSLDVTDLLIAVILAIGIARLVSPFIDRTPHIQWTPAIKLVFVVLWDIVISNFRVAKMVLGPMDQLHPKWYRVPLETEHEQVNTLLAMIITTTPGTVSAGIDQERGDILVHALSTDNAELDIQDIKKRYEMPLIEIFDVKIAAEGATK